MNRKINITALSKLLLCTMLSTQLVPVSQGQGQPDAPTAKKSSLPTPMSDVASKHKFSIHNQNSHDSIQLVAGRGGNSSTFKSRKQLAGDLKHQPMVGLAHSGWPVSGGNDHGSRRAGGGGATNVLKWIVKLPPV